MHESALHRAPFSWRAAPLRGRESSAASSGGLDHIDRYRILGAVGSGGVATVYRAFDPELRRSVALKLMRASICEDASCLAQFWRGAQLAGRLSGPGVVRLLASGVNQRRPYLVLEWVDAEPLSRLLAQHRTLDPQLVVAIAVQLAEALECVHGQGVLHGDIKPSNVLLLRSSGTVKLIDFGASRCLRSVDRGEAAQDVEPGMVLGTHGHMSPEQARGEPLDARSDLYTLGLLLLKLVVGTGLAAAQVAGAGRPAWLRRLIGRCLARKPSGRPASAQALLAEMRAEMRAERRDIFQAVQRLGVTAPQG